MPLPLPPESSFSWVALNIPPFFHFLLDISSNWLEFKIPPLVNFTAIYILPLYLKNTERKFLSFRIILLRTAFQIFRF